MTMSIVELTETATEYRIIQAEIKELEQQLNELKQQLIAEMDSRQAEKVQAGAFTISYAPISQNKFDSALFKKENPETYNAYLKNSVYLRFSVA